MSDKKKTNKKQLVYDAIIDGAQQGLQGEGLFRYVTEVCPNASAKAISKSALLALSDPDIKQKPVLDVIYDLAIRHRFSEPTVEEVVEEQSLTAPSGTPRIKKGKKDAGGA